MNDEILKLAKECVVTAGENWVEAFFKAAFNAGLEAAVLVCENTNFAGVPTYGTEGFECAASIRALEKK